MAVGQDTRDNSRFFLRMLCILRHRDKTVPVELRTQRYTSCRQHLFHHCSDEIKNLAIPQNSCYICMCRNRQGASKKFTTHIFHAISGWRSCWQEREVAARFSISNPRLGGATPSFNGSSPSLANWGRSSDGGDRVGVPGFRPSGVEWNAHVLPRQGGAWVTGALAGREVPVCLLPLHPKVADAADLGDRVEEAFIDYNKCFL